MSTVFVLQQLEPGRWPRSVRAFNPAISHSAGSWPLYFTAHGSPSTRSLPGGRPVLADAHPGTGHPGATNRARDARSLCHSRCFWVSLLVPYSGNHTTVEKCDIGRTLGAINPSSSGGQLAFWSFSNSNPCRQNFC